MFVHFDAFSCQILSITYYFVVKMPLTYRYRIYPNKLQVALELDDEQQKRWFQWSEYADIELTFSLKENDLVCEGKVLNNGSSAPLSLRVSYKSNGS